MSKFRFNLQPVLALRQRIEDDRKLVVARIESERRAALPAVRQARLALLAAGILPAVEAYMASAPAAVRIESGID